MSTNPEPEEILDVVDRSNRIIGSAPKSQIYAERLMHRIVHILIVNDKDELGLQLRSAECSYCPLHWATSVGGHIQSGETPQQAAVRECEEELGTSITPQFFAEDFYSAAGTPDKFLITFRAPCPATLKLDSHSVAKFKFFSIPQIAELIAAGEKIHPELRFLLQKYYAV